MSTLSSLFVRLVLAALIAFKALDACFATILTFTYRAGLLGAAEQIGQLTAGDDYRRLIPLMEAVPLWVHGLMVLAGILYLTAGVSELFVARRAYLPMLAGFVIEVTAAFVSRPIIQATGVVVNPNPSILITLCIPYLLPLFLVLVLWLQAPRAEAATK
jgi:hypothetical protein